MRPGLKTILTPPDHTIHHIREAVAELKEGEALQVELNRPSTALIVLEKLTKTFPHTRFTHETFKSRGKIWMYVLVEYKGSRRTA